MPQISFKLRFLLKSLYLFISEKNNSIWLKCHKNPSCPKNPVFKEFLPDFQNFNFWWEFLVHSGRANPSFFFSKVITVQQLLVCLSPYTNCLLQNKYSLAAETTIKIQLEDVNDMIPGFTEGTSGHVLENEPPGTPVMQVQAIDYDSTPANNKVKCLV